MGLKLVKVLEGAGVGVLDIGLEKLDESQGWVAPANAQTIGRAAGFAAGLIGTMRLSDTHKWYPYLETLMIAEEPLLIRSLVKLTGLIGEYAEAPSREAIELRLRQAGGRGVSPQLKTARFR